MKSFSALLWVISACLMAQTPPPQPSPQVTMDGSAIPLKIETADLGSIPKDKVLVQVNDIKITAGDLEMILKAYPDNTRVFMLGPGRQQFFDQLVRTLVMSEEGKRRKLDADPTYKAQAQYSLAAILANQVNEDIKKNLKVDDAILRKYYEEHLSDYTRLKARHILVRMKGSPVPVRAGQQDITEEEALAKVKELQARIKAGADFAELASAESDDAGSGAKGGDLGVFGHGQMVPSFEEAAYKLKPGELSDPVKSPFGFHLIQVQERQVKSFEELKPELEVKVRPELVKKQVDELINQAKVILAPEALPASKMAK
jgi:peptidyl-prolyl cis-trans isomerase C